MEDEGRQLQFGKVLTTLGYIGLVFSFVGQGFVGESAAGLFLPAIILLFVGRAASRRDRRRPMEDVKKSPEATAKATKPVERPKPPPPQTRSRPRPATPEVDKAKVEADLAKALASYETTKEEPAKAPPARAMTKPETVPEDFQRKSSAEMIEEARRKFNRPTP